MKFIFSCLLLLVVNYGIANDAKIKELVNKWNQIHNSPNLIRENDIYSDYIQFYGTDRDKEYVLTTKEKLLKKAFSQEIISPILITHYKSGIIKCEFTKLTKLNNITRDYPSYLLIVKQNEKFLIKGESDYVTDKNINFNLDLGEVLEIKSYWKHFLILIFSMTIGFLIFRYRRKKSIIEAINSKEVKQNIQTLSNDKIEVSNYSVGYEFEKCISQRFDRSAFQLLEWRGDKYHEGVYAKSNKYPDMEWELVHSFAKPSKFAVECKYRSTYDSNNIIKLCKSSQFENYKLFEINNRIPVFIILGIGGTPTNPNNIYVIPLSKINYNNITSSNLGRFKKRKTNGSFFYDWRNKELS